MKKNTSAAASILAKVNKYVAFVLPKSWILIPLILIGASIAYWRTSKQAPSYVSYARMMVSGKIALPEGAVYSEELSNFYGTQIELMQSGEVRQRAASRVEAERPELRPSPVSLNIQQQRGTSFFLLSATGEQSEYTQAFLDACMREYLQWKRELRGGTADTALAAVTDQLLKLDKELRTGEAELISFQKENSVVNLEEEGNSAGRYLVGLKQQLAELNTELELLKLLDLDQAIARDQNAPKADGKEPAKAENTDPGKTLGQTGAAANYLKAKQQIDLLRAKMERLGKFLRPKHPKMIDLADQVQEQEKLIDLHRQQSVEQLRHRREGIELQIQNVTAAIKEWEARTLQLNQKIAEYSQLKSKVERSKKLSDQLVATVQSVDVNKNLGQDVVTIMERASTPEATRPGLTKSMISGGITGFMLGAAVLGLLAFLDDRLTSYIEVQDSFEEPVLVQIPRTKAESRLNLLNLDHDQQMFGEALRNLRSSLLYMSFEGERPKSYLITSSVPGEGKSTVAANLALVLAESGVKTLLIDADLRRGTLHHILGTESNPGLAEALEQKLSWREALLPTASNTLSFLPRGRPLVNASEHFLGRVIDSILHEVYQEFDYVVIDSAPVLAKEDTGSLAPKVDATLFVVRSDFSKLGASRTAMESLHKRSANILGIIFNAASTSGKDYYYHKYSEYYEVDAV